MNTDPDHKGDGAPDDPPHIRTQRSLPMALIRAREAVMGPMRAILAGSGLNEQKWRVLRVLREMGPMELTPLAEEACLLLPSLTRMVPPMEVEGLVSRTTPPEDRRKVVLAITPKGDALVARHMAEAQAVFDEIEARFGHERLDLLLDLLEEMRHMRLGAGEEGRG